MNRYFYKAKRVSDGKWVYGYLSFIYIDKPEHASIYDPEHVERYDVLTNTLCQCTDRDCYNEAETLEKIFENDIFEVTTFDPFGGDHQTVCVLEYCGGCFSFINKKENFYLCLSSIEDTESDVLKLGNIYDNPGLIGK